MAHIPNGNHRFEIRFPIGFIPTNIKDKYKPYLNRLPNMPFKDTLEFLNSTIKGITIPGLSYSPLEQTRNRGRIGQFKDNKPIKELLTKNFTIEFMKIDGLINYWLMYEIYLNRYFEFTNFIEEPIIVTFFDNDGHEVSRYILKEILYVDLSDFSVDYSENEQRFDTFSAEFIFNDWEIEIL